MNILVTGGAGFIGSYCVKNLVKEGHSVVTYNRNPSADLINRLLNKNELTNVKIEQGDIRDFGHIKSITQENKIESIIHLAAIMVPETDNTSKAIQVNIVGTYNIFQIAKELNLRRVVHAGSSSAQGVLGEASSEIFDEKYLIHNPTGIYGATKAFDEYLAVHFYKNYGIDIINIRLTRTYGAHKNTGGGAAFTNFMKSIALEEPVTIKWGDAGWHYFYVEDAGTVFSKACLVSDTKSKIFNVNDGGYYNGSQFAAIIKELNPNAKVTVEPGRGIYYMPKLDITPAREELRFVPKYSFKEGLRESMNYFRKGHNLPLFK